MRTTIFLELLTRSSTRTSGWQWRWKKYFRKKVFQQYQVSVRESISHLDFGVTFFFLTLGNNDIWRELNHSLMYHLGVDWMCSCVHLAHVSALPRASAKRKLIYTNPTTWQQNILAPGEFDVWLSGVWVNLFLLGPNKITNEFASLVAILITDVFLGWISHSLWSPFIPFPQRQVFQRGAYYSTEVIPGHLAVISLNTLYFYDSNKGEPTRNDYHVLFDGS